MDRILDEAEEKEKRTLRFKPGKRDLPGLLLQIVAETEVDAKAVCTGVRKREVVRARKLFSQIAVLRMGYNGAEVSRFLGLTTSAVNRLPQCQPKRNAGV